MPVLLLLLISLLPISAYADTHTAASCSYADVNTAYIAATDGDTVAIPACSSTAWSSTLTIDKSITLEGAGEGVTTLIANRDTVYAHNLIRILPTAARTVTIGNMTLIDAGVGTLPAEGMLFVQGNYVTFRIHHITFTNLNARAISIYGYHSYGVIDHITYTQTANSNKQFGIVKGGMNATEWDGTWTEAMGFGTANAIYIEDSTFTWDVDSDGIFDAEEGGKIVFRHNTVGGIKGATRGNHGFDSVRRGALWIEAYNNTFTNTGGVSPAHGVFQLRGGTGYFYNNTITGTWNSLIKVTNYRSCSVWSPDTYTYGICDGNNAYDGNTGPIETYRGYPCKDQIGRGTDQALYPVYEYNNTINGSDADVTIYSAGSGTCYTTTHIQENRDFYNDTQMPGYTPYTYPHPLTGGYTISGMVTGLTGTVVLQNNSGDDKTITANGTYSFLTSMATGSTYSVTVSSQPDNQTCSVSNGSGTVGTSNVTDVNITCVSYAAAPPRSFSNGRFSGGRFR